MGIRVVPQAKSNLFTLYFITNCYISVVLKSIWSFYRDTNDYQYKTTFTL